jgi:hypothetical protein
MFEFENRMKIADCLAFCSDRGLYFIGLMDIDPVYKNNFVAIVRSLNVVLQKSPPKTELERANIDLVQYNFYFIYFTVLSYIVYFICFTVQTSKLPYYYFLLDLCSGGVGSFVTSRVELSNKTFLALSYDETNRSVGQLLGTKYAPV